MNVVRMNTAHATPDGIRNIIKNVRTVSPHLALMIDTKGPEVRTTGCAEPIEYKTGDVVKIFGRRVWTHRTISSMCHTSTLLRM